MFRDSDLSNNYLCNFSIPGNTWNKTFYMRFNTLTTWEIIRVDIRPNVVDNRGLRFDNVNLRYRPWVTVEDNLDCISPDFGDVNLVTNGDFSDGDNHWSFIGLINHFVTQFEIMRLSVTSPTSGWMYQPLDSGGYNAPSGRPYEAKIDVNNIESEVRTIQLLLRSADNANSESCVFTVPATSGWMTYTLRFKTSTVWNNMEVFVRPNDPRWAYPFTWTILMYGISRHCRSQRNSVSRHPAMKSPLHHPKPNSSQSP